MSAREWSSYQLAIFRDVAEGEGHTCVSARAGSGKTTTAVEALSHVPPGERPLFVAFNKSIAAELGRRTPPGVDVKTLHGYGLSAVTKAFGRQEVEQHKVDRMARALRARYDEGGSESRKALCKAVSLAKGHDHRNAADVENLCDAYQLEAGDTDEERAEFAADAVKVLGMCEEPGGTIDFDDMVWLPVRCGLRVWQYDRVFIDEVQDLNAVQIHLALKAVRRSGRICAIGDARQAIYAFRGADQNAMTNVVNRLKAKTMSLSVTYRCARKIVEEVKGIVPDLEAAPGAEDGEVERCDEARMTKLAGPGDFILSRTNAPLVPLCLAFLKEGRRACVQGRDVGASLAAVVRKSKAEAVPELVAYVEEFQSREMLRLLAKDPPNESAIQAVKDRADTIFALCEGATSIADVVARIEALFSDGDDKNRIVLSTTHKAKGLERDRVFMLRDTYGPMGRSVEGDNLIYVAATRAKRSLWYVSGGRS